MEALQSLGINLWSVLLYLINVGILLVVLTKFLYRPLFKFMDERRETIRRNLAEAETLRSAFQKEIALREREITDTRRELQVELAEAKRHAEIQAKALISEAQQEKERLVDEARAQIEAMKQKLVSEVEADLIDRMSRITMQVLSHKVPEAVVAESVSDSWKELRP
ncbi:MAG: F0F1 ATP synthase subunit B [bacterium]|nr:F0F1 ATP synthase subunit B [bacterium]